MKTNGRIALGFTPYAGQSRQGLDELFDAAGFVGASAVEEDRGFCVLATKP
jgi:hypothetical protein